jgi:hypothetical protein
MRGKSKNNKMTRTLLEKIFREIKFVKRLFLTGGEVFTCYEEIKTLFEIIKEKNVTVATVEITTNGTIYDERIYNLLEKYYKNNYFINISIDDYHEAAINESSNKELLKENILKHFEREYLPEITNLYTYLYNVGNAKTLDKPKFDFVSMGYHYCNIEDKILVVGPIIFIDSLGYISDGNTSYDMRESKSLGNINNTSLISSIMSNAVEFKSNNIKSAYKKLDLIEYNFNNFKGKYYDILNNKLVEVKFTKPTIVEEERNKFLKAISNIDLENSSIEEIMSCLDFSTYPHDISQTYHKK